jgi:hypothetical protein
MDEVIPVYLDTGDIGDITFKWKHPTAAVEYELWLAKDEAFSQTVSKQVIKPESQLPPGWILPRTVSLDKGETYYWKIRVTQAETGETGEGKWSKVMAFSVASLPSEDISRPETSPAVPSNGAPKETGSLPWIATIPPWVWIAVALLLIVVPIIALLASRTKR